MLQAIKHRKISVNLDEDPLTSSVFGYLLLLDDEEIWDIFKKAIFNSNELPESIGRLIEHEFWPHWNVADISKVTCHNLKISDKKSINKNSEYANVNYVEPDLFLSFEKLDIIVEAKRYDHKQQIESQWKKEYCSYFEDIHHDSKDVILLAVGGINSETKSYLKGIKFNPNKKFYIYKCHWSKILECIKNKLNYKKKLSITQKRIYKSLIDIFDYFDFHTVDWEGFKFNNIAKINKFQIMEVLDLWQANLRKKS